jgi:hypothetical protein
VTQALSIWMALLFCGICAASPSRTAAGAGNGELTVSAADSALVLNGNLLSIAHTNSISLSGTNTIPNTARVLVNGVESIFSSGEQRWSQTATLNPGFNRLIVQAFDTNGTLLAFTNRDVLLESSQTSTGGVLGSNSTWNGSMGVIHITNNVVVPPDKELTIEPGTVVLARAGFGIRATNATVKVSGTAEQPVYFLPEDGSSLWSGIVISGPRGTGIVQHVEMAAGLIQILGGSSALLEDSTFRDYPTAIPPIVYVENSPSITIRRCHLTRHYEAHFVSSRILVEDCLIEHMSYETSMNSDGIDLDSTPPGCVIRRCTIRHGPQANIDAVDIGTGCRETLIEDCMMYDMSDKGVSIGEASLGIEVRNCLMYEVDAGVAVKDGSTANLHEITVADSDYGFHVYQKTPGMGGGHITNAFNNILWSDANSLAIDNLSDANIRYSDIEGLNQPGSGNINSDPLFLNPADHDYRVANGSPALGSGEGGANMGASFPLGAPMSPSEPSIDSITETNGLVRLAFHADTEKSYEVESSSSLVNSQWTTLTNIWPGPYPQFIQITNQAPDSAARFYRLRATRFP